MWLRVLSFGSVTRGQCWERLPKGSIIVPFLLRLTFRIIGHSAFQQSPRHVWVWSL